MCNCKAPLIETAIAQKASKNDFVIISVYNHDGTRMTMFDHILRTTSGDDLRITCSRCGADHVETVFP